MPIDTVRLGRTELTVPVCGFGGIPVGRDQVNDEEGAAIVRRAVESGLTLVDTFCAYGRSEERIGMALEGRYDGVTLVTKSRARFEPDEFKRMIEDSLVALRTDCIDVLLLKNVDNQESLDGARQNVRVLERLREAGVIKHIGLSSHSPEFSAAAIEDGYIEVAEVPFNYANRHFEPVLDLAAEKDVGILAMKPLGGGRLFNEAQAEDKGAPASLDTLVDALSFAMSHACNPVLIPGIGTEAELDRYLEAVPRLRRLTDAERDALTDRATDLGDDFCRACGYCASVCPSGIPIDEILPLLDRAESVRTDGTFTQVLKRRFAALGADPDACTLCRKCIEECPFNLEIPQRLKRAFETLG